MLVVAAAGSSSRATLMKAKSAIITAALLGPNPKERLLLARDWASVRKSPDVDAYVLALDREPGPGSIPTIEVQRFADCLTRGADGPTPYV